MKWFALVVCLTLAAGCATSMPDPCRDPEPYPVGYWSPPEGIAELDPEPVYTVLDVPADAGTEAEVEAITADLLTAAAAEGSCRAKYEALVKRILTDPPPD